MSLTSTTTTTATTLPSWFGDAQESIKTKAGTAYDNALLPANQTVGTQLIKDLGGATNPFMTASNNLGTIQTNLMNPFLSQEQGGGYNTASPLGALFSAQNAKLDQILPQVTAKEGAAGLGAGNFGGLRGQTATGAARAGALTTLAEQQNKAALDAYSTATQAAQAQGNVANQYSSAVLPLAKYQQTGGLDALAKYSDIVNAMGPTLNKTTTETKEGSTLSNVGQVVSGLKAAGVGIDKILSGSTGIGWLDNYIKGNPQQNWLDSLNITQEDMSRYIDENGNIITAEGD